MAEPLTCVGCAHAQGHEAERRLSLGGGDHAGLTADGLLELAGHPELNRPGKCTKHVEVPHTLEMPSRPSVHLNPKADRGEGERSKKDAPAV